MRKIKWQTGLLCLGLLQSISLWAQWGEIKKEQIEDAFLRNNAPDVMESANASLTINAADPGSPEQAVLVLQNQGSEVFSAQANGDVSIGGGLGVDDNLEASGNGEFGISTETSSGADGLQAGWHLNEQSGTLDNFESTAAYDMTTYNTPTYGTDGVFDGALTFESSSNEYAEVASALGIAGWPVTLTVWFKTSTVVAQTIFAFADASAGNVVYSLEIRGIGHAMGMRRNTTATYALGNSFVCDGEWHQVAFVIDGNADSKLYVDGILEAIDMTPVTWNAAIDTSSMGRCGDSSPSGYFDGTIDEVVIYDTALSAAAIKELYARGNKTRIQNGYLSAMIVDASNVAGISLIALDDITQKYDSDYTRPVPIMEDSVGYPHQAIYYGTCSDGSVTYTSDGFRTAFASGCTPVVTISPEYSGNSTVLSAKVTSSNNTGFTYTLHKWNSVTGQWDPETSTYLCHWQAMGWVD